MNQIVESATTIMLAIVGVAILAVLVSRNANTTGVIQAGGSAFSNALATAESPVSGSSVNPIVAYPGATQDSFALSQNIPLGL